MPTCSRRCCSGKANAVGAAADDSSDAAKVSQLRPLVRRYWMILALSWCMQTSLGIAISVPGPTLPYLALKVSEPLDRLGYMFTASSLTSCAAAWLTAVALARLAASSRAKLFGLLLGNALMAGALLGTPFAESLAGLIAAQCAMGAGTAVISTVDNMLVIYLFGPVLSRSFSHSLHFCIGIGGFLAPVLARPFLIQMGDIGADGDVCGGVGDCEGRGNATLNSTSTVNLEPLKWPFVTIGCLHSLWLCGYTTLLLLNFQLVRHSWDSAVADAAGTELPAEGQATTAQAVASGTPASCHKWTVVSLFVLFYVLHAGQESGFWSYLYSFGVCSRLCFSPDQSSLLNTLFFVGYLASRGAGVLVSGWVRPSVMLLAQLAGCLATTAALAAWGDSLPAVAFAGAAAYGFCIAMVFPTGITWLASKLDVTGSLASTWSVGTYIGASTYPLVTGLLIGSPFGAISIMYLAVGTAAVYFTVAVVMIFLARTAR